jgi:hypothetical protein
MRSLRTVALVGVCILALGLLVAAKENKFGVADTRQVSFDDAIYVGNVLLPKGNYEVKHIMEADNHIMVFTQLRVKHPAEARVKCTLVPLPAKANQNTTIYIHNDSNQHVLQELVFKGDTAKHVF